MKTHLALLLASFWLLMCSPQPAPIRLQTEHGVVEVPADVASRPARAVAGFDGYYHNGHLFLTVHMPDGTAIQYATDSPLTTQSSGSSGTTTPSANTVLLHQTMAISSSTRDTSCNSSPFGDTGIPNPFQGVCVPIQAINGYSQYVLNPYVQLLSLSACGTTTSVTTYVKDASSSTIGVDNTLGLWAYTQTDNTAVLYPAADSMSRDRATRNWFFATDQPGASACFRFSAVVMGQLWSP